MSQKTQENFAGQTFFIGLDVHKKQWTVAIRTQGVLVKRLSMNPSPGELKRFLNRQYPGGTYRSVYEAGFCGFWIHQQLSELGITNIVVHAPDIPTSDKERKGKNDRRDARKLSRELEHGSLTGIYVPGQENRFKTCCQ
jgi:transposase